MPIWIAALLGVVEGLTEFLPVSSTGHLILVGHFLGEGGEATKTFEVVIQSGAILAVVVHFRALLGRRVAGVFRRDPDALRLLYAITAAFIPTAIVGFLLRKIVKRWLFAPIPVAAALIVGGIFMIVVERVLARRPPPPVQKLEEVDVKRGFLIGLAQCVSIWPGSSRAMCTIVGGQLTGLTAAVAAEFSFLLALPVLVAATALDLVKSGKELVATSAARAALGVGFLVSFLVAWAVIGVFLKYLRRHGMAVFGVYRIAIGVFVLVAARFLGLTIAP